MRNNIHNICFDCGKKIDKKHKTSFGTWLAICDMCFEEKLCADAQHDFGYYNNEDEKVKDKVQDLM